MHRTGILAALVGLLALAGTVSAQGVGTVCDLVSQHAEAGCSASADPTEGAYAGAADAAHDDASAALDAAAGHTDVETAKQGGFFAWLRVGFDAFVAKLGDVLGLAGKTAPATEGKLNVGLGTEGVEVETGVGDARATASANANGASAAASGDHASARLAGTLDGVNLG